MKERKEGVVGKASIFDHVICLFNELKMGIQYHNTLKYAHNIIHKVMLIKFIRSIFSMPFHEVMGPAIGAVVLRDRFVTGPFYHGAVKSQCRLITVPLNHGAVLSQCRLTLGPVIKTLLFGKLDMKLFAFYLLDAISRSNIFCRQLYDFGTLSCLDRSMDGNVRVLSSRCRFTILIGSSMDEIVRFLSSRCHFTK